MKLHSGKGKELKFRKVPPSHMGLCQRLLHWVGGCRDAWPLLLDPQWQHPWEKAGSGMSRAGAGKAESEQPLSLALMGGQSRGDFPARRGGTAGTNLALRAPAASLTSRHCAACLEEGTGAGEARRMPAGSNPTAATSPPSSNRDKGDQDQLAL